VLDGDAFSPRGMARRRELRRFSNDGRWVLVLDVGSRHHRRVLARHTGFEALARGRHRSRSFLFRHAVVNGVPRTIMLDTERLAPAGSGNLGPKRLRRSKRAEANRVADLIADHVRASGRGAAQGGGDACSPAPRSGALGDAKVPDEALRVGYSYCVTGTHHPKDTWLGCASEKNYQDTQWTMNHNFTVYLDNSVAHPQGDYQVITYDFSGTFNPVRQGTSFWSMFDASCDSKNPRVRAWWTGLLKSSVAPADAATDGKLTWQATGPNTPNTETTASSEDGFDVGISAEGSGGGVNATYHVQHGTSYSIPDWGVVSNTSGNHAQWEFSSRSSCDPRSNANPPPQDNCFTSAGGHPNLPNELSRSQLAVDTSARWRTKQLLTEGQGNLSFTVANPVTLISTGCVHTLLTFCTSHDIDRDGVGPDPRTYAFDVSDTIPVPIKSVDLNPTTANGAKNQTVTGTVTLARPSPFETKVVIFSNKENAVVGTPVTDQVTQGAATINKGDTTGKFTVQTNDNHLASGGHVTAYITAFYAEAFDPVPLRVESPKGG
jgi:hypothetical protein